jgi:MFS family permease
MAAIVGIFSREEPVSVPLIAEFTFRGGAGLFAAMMALFSVGAILGGLFLAQTQPSPRALVVATVGFGLAMLGAAVAPNEVLVLIAMVPVGAFAIFVAGSLQSHLQLSTESAMRGRVMALFSMAFIGSAAIGGPIIGWAGDHLGPRWGLGVGAIAAIIAAGLGYAALIRPSPPAAERPQTGADIQSTVS